VRARREATRRKEPVDVEETDERGEPRALAARVDHEIARLAEFFILATK
jgi:hypothetical protein